MSLALDKYKDTTGYRVKRLNDQHGHVQCWGVKPVNEEYELDLRLDILNHSPSGFEVGYAGSGPSQLGLAILADLTQNNEIAHRLHNDFTKEFLAELDLEKGEDKTISRKTILNFLRNHKVAP